MKVLCYEYNLSKAVNILTTGHHNMTTRLQSLYNYTEPEPYLQVCDVSVELLFRSSALSVFELQL